MSCTILRWVHGKASVSFPIKIQKDLYRGFILNKQFSLQSFWVVLLMSWTYEFKALLHVAFLALCKGIHIHTKEICVDICYSSWLSKAMRLDFSVATDWVYSTTICPADRVYKFGPVTVYSRPCIINVEKFAKAEPPRCDSNINITVGFVMCNGSDHYKCSSLPSILINCLSLITSYPL